MPDAVDNRSVLPAPANWLEWGSAAVGDALGQQDRPFQCMEGGIRPIAPRMKVAGPAFTVRTYPGATWALEQAIEQATPGDVLVIDAGGRPDVIIMGELMSLRAQQRGIVGAVVDGAVRDVDAIEQFGFPLFARYITPRAGTHDHIGEWQTPIACGRVVVHPGNMVVADDSGIVVVPVDALEDVAKGAAAIKTRETKMAEHLRAGADLPTAAASAKNSMQNQ